MQNLLRRCLVVFGDNDNIICIISNIFKLFYYEWTSIVDVIAKCAIIFFKIWCAINLCMELYIYMCVCVCVRAVTDFSYIWCVSEWHPEKRIEWNKRSWPFSLYTVQSLFSESADTTDVDRLVKEHLPDRQIEYTPNLIISRVFSYFPNITNKNTYSQLIIIYSLVTHLLRLSRGQVSYYHTIAYNMIYTVCKRNISQHHIY
jgi:hypothetical protein